MFRVHALYAKTVAPRAALPAIAAQRFVASTALAEQIDDAQPAAFAGSYEWWVERRADALAAWAAAERGARADVVILSEEHIPFEKPWAGARIKGKFVFRRRPDLGVAAFQTHWRERHAPIVAHTPEMLRYIQSHVVPEQYARARPAYDGITEIHWRDVASARRSMSSTQMTVDQSNDARNFVEPGSVVLVLMTEAG
jgi:uncharacterized protein (TIGR02118 family)